MKKPEFIEKHMVGRIEYHLPVPERFISSTLFDSSELNLGKEIFNDLISFTTDANISSLIGWDENAILYYIALKVLATEKECLLIYFNNQNSISGIQENVDTTKAEWWNSIQYMQGDEFCQCFGMQGPEAFLEAANYSNKDLSNRYFYIGEIDNENINRYTKIYSSDVTHWCFIFCESKNKQDIKSIVTNKQEKSSLESILKLSSSLVNIQIGSDEGYLDYVLIQSESDLRDSILNIEKKQFAFIQEYENLLKECKPFDAEWKVDFYKEKVLDIIKKVA